MARSHAVEEAVAAPPEVVLRLAGDPAFFTSLWPFVEEARVDEKPPRVRFAFKRFGFTMRAEYPLEIEAGEGVVVYRGVAGSKRFTVTVRAAPAPGGARVRVEVEYEGPFESLSTPFLREFASRLAAGLKAAAATTGGRGLRDPGYVASLILAGRLVERGRVKVTDQAAAHELVARLTGLSKGRRVFARILAGGLCARLLLRDGTVEDAVMEHAGRLIEGPSVIEALLDALPGNEVELLVLEVD